MSNTQVAERRAQAASDRVGEKSPAAAVCETISSAWSGAAQKKRSSSKRRRSRAVPKAPVRELSAHDKAQFKRIVEQFTGLPLSPPPPPPAPPPALITPIPIRPSLSPPPDNPQLVATSAVAHSLLSTLHLVSACLQLLHGGASQPANLVNQKDESKSKSLASLKGLFHPHSASQNERHTIASCGGGVENNSLFCVDDVLANELGSSFQDNSLLGHNDLNPLFVNTHLACGSVDFKSSFGHDGDPIPFFSMQSHDIPKNPHDHLEPSNSYCSDGCGGACLHWKLMT